MAEAPTLSERADELEHRQMQEFGERIVGTSLLYSLSNGERSLGDRAFGGRMLMGEDSRLPAMPDKPTLLDFFRCRFDIPALAHLLQSANLAQKNGLSDKMVLACLLHDIAVAGFIRTDHGYWGAQLIEPYVDEEVSWAIRAHQALRFFPDESVGYAYPDNYRKMFGDDYQPEPYVVAAYEEGAKAQVVHVGPDHLRERPLFLRSRRPCRARAVRGCHRPGVPPARRGSRQRQHPGLAYVAHAALALQRALTAYPAPRPRQGVW